MLITEKSEKSAWTKIRKSSRAINHAGKIWKSRPPSEQLVLFLPRSLWKTPQRPPPWRITFLPKTPWTGLVCSWHRGTRSCGPRLMTHTATCLIPASPGPAEKQKPQEHPSLLPCLRHPLPLSPNPGQDLSLCGYSG